MNWSNLESELARLRANCIALFVAHRKQQLRLRSLVRTRIQRQASQREWLLKSLEKSPPVNSLTPLESLQQSINEISGYHPRVTVTCTRGHNRASFSGTPYRVANQVNLFLTTGMSGDTLQEKSSTDLLKEVASSSYASALLRHRSAKSSTSPGTDSYVQAIHPHEEYARQRLPSPEAGSSLQSTPASQRWGMYRLTGD